MAHAPSQDFRTAGDDELLEAIAAQQPLALAEAYHRLVPAAHAVARRMVSGTGEVEEVLLTVFEQLWNGPPAAGPLEAWVRRATWAAAAERLRGETIAPASPSAAGLLPDLPAPDVRFLDAAERAIAELPDDERRALLLAHDKGVASSGQEAGAGAAMTKALLALAGPETSAADRSAMQEDPAEDVEGLGDWCLGIADRATAADVAGAIEARPGAAARSRAVRRGRRRIEGLPATPDMGQRVLVRVLTGASAMAAAPPPAMAPPSAAPAATTEPAGTDATPTEPDTDVATPAVGLDMTSGDEGLTRGVLDQDDPFADLDADDAPAEEPDGVLAVGDPMMDTADLPAAGETEDAAAAPPAEPDAAEGPVGDAGEGGEGTPSAVLPGHEDWAPNPGDTAELRLSDILAEGDEEDDPFADLEREDPAAEPASTSPYAALQDLSGQPEPQAAPAPFSVAAAQLDQVGRPEGGEVYIEGQEPDLEPRPRSRNPVAAFLSWLLPILGGAAVGVLIAVSVFGPPS